MKTNIVEFGTVIEKKDNIATVVLDKGTSCRKCGMAALGLCKPGGSGLIVKVEDSLNTKVGDRVKLGLKSQIHFKGYLLAFIVPLAGFVISAILGYILGVLLKISSLEVPLGLVGLVLSSYLSFKALKKMDKIEKMHIERIISIEEINNETFLNPESSEYLKRYSS